MREHCVFQAKTETPDGGGGVAVSWSFQFERRGALAFAKLSTQLEAIQQGALTTARRATLTVREDPQTRLVTNDWRVEVSEDGYRAEVWNIRQIQRVERGYLRMVIEDE